VNGFVDVQDVVRAMMLLMNSNVEAERFILCAENISYKDLFTQIAKAFQKQPPHKKVTPLLAELIWRIESLKYMLTKKAPMITKDTAHTALQTVRFDNSKLLNQFPHFCYTPLQQTIERICAELLQTFKTEIKN
jgi:nucleoside-diphosphate-sugar epimerase